MKKLFGGLNLTWKKLIIYAVIAGVYTALMAMIPITKDTSFRDIAITFEWWIFFGIIIISNSKSPLDSALKCFVFFLISQPLVYLIQVPFSSMGWKLFGYYRTWFLWTLACLPMGFIGYYINKKNWISVIILLPMFLFLILSGTGYFKQTFETFPNHLLSGISCFAMIIVVTLGLFDEFKYKLIMFGLSLIGSVGMLLLGISLINTKYEAVKTLGSYNIVLEGDVLVPYSSGTKEGKVEIIKYEDGYNVKLIGYEGGEYEFSLSDDNNHEYKFKYYFDKDKNEVILELIK